MLYVKIETFVFLQFVKKINWNFFVDIESLFFPQFSIF